MSIAPCHRRRCRQRLPGAGRSNSAGFSLIEIMIAMVLVTTSFLVGAVSGTSGLTAMMRNLSISSQEGLIDEDIANIRKLAEDLSWCSGSGSTAPTAGGSCATNTSLRSNYYFPNFPAAESANEPPPEQQQILNFEAACSANEPLTKALITAIDQLPVPTGLRTTRTVALHDPEPDAGAQTHVLQVTYQDNDPGSFQAVPIERQVLILPTVTAWCP